MPTQDSVIANLQGDDFAPLVDGEVPSSYLPGIALNTVTVVANQAARLALAGSVEEGDVCKQSDTGKSYWLNSSGNGSQDSHWTLVWDADIVPDDVAAANNTVVVGSSGGYAQALSVSASRILARLANGDLKACTVEEIVALLNISGGSEWTYVYLGSDQTNNNGTANTMQDVTGLSFTATSGVKYEFEAVVIYTAAATTTGSRWAVNGPAATTLHYRSRYSLGVQSITSNEGLTAYDMPSVCNSASAATGSNTAVVQGVIQPSSTGTVVVRFASEISGSAIVAKASFSYLRYRELP